MSRDVSGDDHMADIRFVRTGVIFFLFIGSKLCSTEKYIGKIHGLHIVCIHFSSGN